MIGVQGDLQSAKEKAKRRQAVIERQEEEIERKTKALESTEVAVKDSDEAKRDLQQGADKLKVSIPTALKFFVHLHQSVWTMCEPDFWPSHNMRYL